ncbi:hypothetical protein [Solidesulfovibrio sp.]
MFDALTRCILNLLPLPRTPDASNEQLAFCVNVQTKIARCQSRVDSIFVLFSNNKYEECLLLAQETLPRLTELRCILVTAMEKSHGGQMASTDAGLQHMQHLTDLATVTMTEFSGDHINALSFLVGELQESLSGTRKLFQQYRRRLPVFSEQYAYIGKRVVPFLAVIVFVGVFISGLYVSKLFASFKDLDIRFNWLAKDIHSRVVITGVELTERDGNNNTVFAWGHGPRTTVAFNCPGSFQFELELQVVPCLKDQFIDVVINGKNVQRITQTTGDCTPGGPPEKIFFDALKGVNIVEIVYSDWNMHTVQYFSGEQRPLSARFYAFSLKRTYRP